MSLTRIIQILNILVFILWWTSQGTPRYAWMMEHFLVSYSSIMGGRWWTSITSAFSHNLIFHLFINMYVLTGFGSMLEKILGWKKYLVFYLLAGISGSLAHSLISVYWLNEPNLPALGASGAIAGIILFYSLLFPKDKLLLLGFIPVGARWAALIIIGIDGYGLYNQVQGGSTMIGHGAHLGGAVIGIIYYLIFRRRHKYRP